MGLEETLWGLVGCGLDQQEAEGLKTVVALLEDPSLAPSSHMGQPMTACARPAPVNETDTSVPFCISGAREAEAGESGVQIQPWLHRKFEASLKYTRVSFQKPNKEKN